MEDRSGVYTITRASAAVVNREPVGVYQAAGEPEWWPMGLDLPDNLSHYSTLSDLVESECAAALIISDEQNPFRDRGTTLEGAQARMHVVLYRPASLVAGMGCRRGVPMGELDDLLKLAFEDNNLSLASLSTIATAELKRDEEGLQELARKLGVPLTCFDAHELNGVFAGVYFAGDSCKASAGPCHPESMNSKRTSSDGHGLHPSENARRLSGVWGVAEPAALLAAGSDRLLVSKQTAARATVAVARKEFL